eukprot:5278710-Lingulodinium_polyedra.AAC.1
MHANNKHQQKYMIEGPWCSPPSKVTNTADSGTSSLARTSSSAGKRGRKNARASFPQCSERSRISANAG